MKINVTLDVMLAKRKMKLNELSEKVGISVTNLSLLKTGKAKGIRFNTLLSICEVLDCEPGDIIAIERE
ncbi:MAG: helix-turn-helix transcriptional regulator [Bacteroidota bacterium]